MNSTATITGHFIVPDHPRLPVAILGVPIDSITMDEALGRIDRMVRSGRPHYVVTPNVDFLVQGREDPELHRILLEADLVLCDGQPLVWASRLLGNPLPERVAGADLVPHLITLAEHRGYRLFLLGATPEANARAAARLQARHPRLQLAGSYAPPFRPLEEMDHGEIGRRIREARPDLLLVSFGCPKQEKWIARNYRSLGVPVSLGVGAVIDFLAGTVRRAPHWMRATGLEWSWRLAQEPRRLFRRYATDLRCFGGALLAQWWRMHPRGTTPVGSVLITEQAPVWQHAFAVGHLDRPAIEQALEMWRRVGDVRRDCVLDLRGVEFIDSTGAALLMTLWKELHRAGHRLVLLRPSATVRRLLGRMGLLDYLELAEADPTEA